jgi:outer membrane receptor protein involved in Fe transport
MEFDWTWDITPTLAFYGNTTYMKSLIKEYAPEDVDNVYYDVTPALSPEWIFNAAIDYTFLKHLTLRVNGRYVSDSYQEPTNNPAFMMPSFFVADAGISYAFGKSHSLDLFFNNILDKQYFTYGAPVDIDYNGVYDEPGYFIQPPRNVYARLLLKF